MPNGGTTVFGRLVLDLVVPNPNDVSIHQLGDSFRKLRVENQISKLAVCLPCVDNLDDDPTSFVTIKFAVEKRFVLRLAFYQVIATLPQLADLLGTQKRSCWQVTVFAEKPHFRFRDHHSFTSALKIGFTAQAKL
jgi:hypothetical protein